MGRAVVTRRFSICQTCHKVVDLDWDAHDGGVDGTGTECWYCPACCPAPQCVPEPSEADLRRVDL